MARRSKPRDEEDLVFGLHAVSHLLRTVPERVRELKLARERHDLRLEQISELADAAGIRAQAVDRKVLDQASSGAVHQGVMAVIRPRPAGGEQDLESLLEQLEAAGRTPLLLVLDGIQDPHNLGACLRTADATGVHAVIAPKDRASGLTATARKVSSGAAETVPFIQVTNLARTLRMLAQRGILRVGTDGETEADVFTVDLTGPLALVMGSEGRGLRRLTRENCDLLMRLPMLGSVESLNVSVATGVCLYFALAARTGDNPGESGPAPSG